MPAWLAPLAAWLAATGWGDLVGFLGSLVGILGVPVAAWQAWRARSAAQAAALAVRDAQRRLSAFDTVVAISTAIERLQSIKSLHREGRWEVALDRYAAQRRELIAIRERDRHLTQGEQTIIQSAILLLELLETRVERAQGTGETLNVASLNRQIASSTDALQAMLQSKQARSVERQHG